MPLIYRAWTVRKDLLAHPHRLFVFGDNILQTALGGQATEMRGQPNAVGIPTKKAPHMGDAAFFDNSDGDIALFLKAVEAPFHRLTAHMGDGGTVVWPEEGLRTAMADLQNRAPRIASAIETIEAILYELSLNAAAA